MRPFECCLKSIAQNFAFAFRFVISYPVHNENKPFIISRYISIVDNRYQKEKCTIASIIEFW